MSWAIDIAYYVLPISLQYSYRKMAMNECTYDFYELQWSNLYEKSWNNDTISQKPILLDATNHLSYVAFTCKDDVQTMKFKHYALHFIKYLVNYDCYHITTNDFSYYLTIRNFILNIAARCR